MIGTRIGQYQIESQLGAGGMGVVYRAFDSRLERHVAIKVFPDLATSPKARSRLLHEARSASALNHPNVCTVHEVGESGDITYLVMEFVEGRTLRRRFRRADSPPRPSPITGRRSPTRSRTPTRAASCTAISSAPTWS